MSKKSSNFANETKTAIMETLSVKDFRSKMAESFNRSLAGEKVYIRRKNEIYALIKMGHSDLNITPELQQRFDEVYKAYEAGECVTCNSHEELANLLNSL